MNNPPLAPLLWPASRLGDALLALAPSQQVQKLWTEQWTPDWIENAARSIGLEAQPVETFYAEFENLLPKMGPAIIHVPAHDSFLVLLSGLTALAPDRRRVRIAPSALRSALCGEMESPVVAEIEQTLDRAGIPRTKQARARAAILRGRLRAKRIRGIWVLRLPSGSDFWTELRQAGVPWRLTVLTGAHAVQYALWILAWWVVGVNVLSGRPDRSWLVLWGLLLLTLVPLRVFITWLQGLLAFGAGARLKQRLFAGALRLDPDNMRHQGAGQLLGRVLESEAVEALALSGGFLALVAVIELLFAVVVLGFGAAGPVHSVSLFAWVVVTAYIAWKYFQRNRQWTGDRLSMTHDLIESMVGHRTRLAQLPPDRWHEGEDETLEQYLKTSKLMDDSTLALLALVPRGWLVVGLIGLTLAFVRGAASPGKIAIAVGGMLLAYRALRRLTSGAWQLTGAAVAWERVSVLFRAAAKSEPLGSLNVQPPENSAVIDACNLSFRYSERTGPILDGCSLQVAKGDRIVLEGASGGGKSTLVSLLAGVREPSSGRLLIDGVDRKLVGSEAWRARVAAAPQFHENHVLAETFAFNLFMGRRTVLGPADFEQAETICRELGLGEVLARMPGGMLQMVGETGWQLSHGERSRLYIARALLQDAELVILDESFAALDPENLQRALACVLKRARSLLVIAHR